MAYQQTATRANIEFLKSSAPGICGGRAIKLNYGPQQAPTQLQGRVAPALWADFMSQVHALADRHPYLVKPGGKQYSNWLLAAVVGAVVGLFCFSPDAGSYPQWEAEVNTVLQRYQPVFNQNGITLSMQHSRESWIQIDVGAVAQGLPNATAT